MKIFASLDVPIRPQPATGLVGRQVANASFLEALLRYSDFDAFHFFPGDAHDQRLFLQDNEAHWQQWGMGDRVQCFGRFELPQRLSETDYHVFHQSDFVTYFAALCRLRSRYAKRPFPVTAPIHSISYPSYMEVYLRILLGGPTAADAIVCTSRAGREAVENGLRHAAQMPPIDALGLVSSLELAHIPLGVEVERYHPADADTRLLARKKLGLPIEGTLALCLGRFSEADKYDLVPLLVAFQDALHAEHAADQGKLDRSFLILAGARQGNNYPERLKDVVLQMGLAHHVRFLVDVTSEQQRQLYQAADLFVSPSDNIQETFGLTVVEAMASGLPVIASDWDGYKDLVEHGVSGLLVPTYAGGWDDFLGELGPLTYQRAWHLAVAQGTVLDLGSLTTHLRALLLNPILRLRMGMEARKRSEQFAWSRVIAQYLALWETLKDRAVALLKPGNGGTSMPPDPLGAPPFALFSGHPTARLPDEARFELTERGQALLKAPNARPWYHELDALFDATILRHLCARVRLGASAREVTVEVAQTYGCPESGVSYQLHWLLKQGYVRMRR